MTRLPPVGGNIYFYSVPPPPLMIGLIINNIQYILYQRHTVLHLYYYSTVLVPYRQTECQQSPYKKDTDRRKG